MGCIAADLLREGELRLRPNLHPHAQAGLRFHLGLGHIHNLLQGVRFPTLLRYQCKYALRRTRRIGLSGS
jgi:hypothetical protein